MTTGRKAGPISGPKLYQKRARAALPILVRQAQAGMPIIYTDLARELGIPNPRNLNYVLASIGVSLDELSNEWSEKIPPIECLVLNKKTRLPGEGVGWFLDRTGEYSKLALRQRKLIVQDQLQEVILFQKWPSVLAALSLQPVDTRFVTGVDTDKGQRRGGESDQHKKMKEYVARNPSRIGLKPNTPLGVTEQSLPSGDSLDVSFNTGKAWVAVEVKTVLSNDADIIRGIFQCVKYKAVMEAVVISQGQRTNIRSILVLEGQLPACLVGLKNVLGVEVVEAVTVP